MIVVEPRVLILGGNSAIAKAVARRYACRKARVMLLGMRVDSLEAVARDLAVRCAREVTCLQFDALAEMATHESRLDEAWSKWEGFDVILVAYGTLPDQALCELEPAAAASAFDVNGRSVVVLGMMLARRLEKQGYGHLGFIVSPAGLRGRRSNFLYGAAKAAVITMASGLRHKLYSQGIRVTAIFPGFVDTPMTAGFTKGILWVSPGRISRDIEWALDRGVARVYTPWFWRWIMLVVRLLPDRVFVRTRL